MARGFKVADAYVELTIDKDTLAKGVRDIPRSVGGDLDRSGTDMGRRIGKSLGDESKRQGDDAGGKLALGMRMSIIRNSPLIVAAVGAALAVGAPAMLAAAAGLFAGIGIVAAAQSEQVQSAWLGTWRSIRAGAIADAKPIEAVLVNLAGRVASGFEQMRPALRNIFRDVAPQIEVFADGLLGLVQNSLPGFERAIARSMPVTKGFADFLERTGTGLSDFFDTISEHAPAAGTVFSALGDIMAELLPILAELLGQGAELAAAVLPALASVLGVVADVVDRLGPLLPAIVLGFAGMKVANSVLGGVAALGGALDRMAASGGAFSGVAGKMAGGLGSIGAAAGPAAAGIGFAVTAALAWVEAGKKSEEQAVALGRALEVGGGQADAAAAYVDKFAFANNFLDTGLGSAVGSLGAFGYTISDMVPDLEQGAAAYDAWYQKLDPGARATEDVAVATQRLEEMVSRYGSASPEAETAARALTEAQREQAQLAAELEMATRGVTEAMLAQADAAMGLADADLAHRNAMDAAEDSLAAYNEAVRAHGATSEEASDAARAWEADLSRIVATAGQLATETLPANMDANSKLALSQIAQRDMLRELSAQYGGQLPAALQTALASLEQTTAGYDVAALEAAALAAETDNTSGKMDKLGAKKPTPSIQADSSVFAGKHAEAMGKIAQLAAQQPTPTVHLNDLASGGINKVALKLASLQNRTVTITTIEKSVKAKAAGGPIFAAIGRKITGPGGPTDDLVQAIGPGGSDYRLSAGEWIVNAMASRREGDAAMAMLNAGQATIVPTATPSSSGGSTAPGSVGTLGRPAAGGSTYNLALHMHGVDWHRPQDRRRILTEFRAGIIDLEREQS